MDTFLNMAPDDEALEMLRLTEVPLRCASPLCTTALPRSNGPGRPSPYCSAPCRRTTEVHRRKIRAALRTLSEDRERRRRRSGYPSQFNKSIDRHVQQLALQYGLIEKRIYEAPIEKRPTGKKYERPSVHLSPYYYSFEVYEALDTVRLSFRTAHEMLWTLLQLERGQQQLNRTAPQRRIGKILLHLLQYLERLDELIERPARYSWSTLQDELRSSRETHPYLVEKAHREKAWIASRSVDTPHPPWQIPEDKTLTSMYKDYLEFSIDESRHDYEKWMMDVWAPFDYPNGRSLDE